MSTTKIEVLYDDEIATGLTQPEYKFLPEGAVIAAPQAAAKSLVDSRRARVSTAKVNVDLSAPDKIPAAIDKILDARLPEDGEPEE